ncbi:MAG TPA: hypothetical protein VFF27_17205, partial [Bacteroidia bacterium]|nr:hypothetical protein [Bacteroidia bacterium]
MSEFVSTYRYGFNGQEKDDEVVGNGNSYTAEFWQYDARLGRRWNLDPKADPSISFYATFSNNPLWFTDPLGDTTYNFSASTKKYIGMTDLNKPGKVGAIVGPKGESIKFEFVDPVNDSKAIE